MAETLPIYPATTIFSTTLTSIPHLSHSHRRYELQPYNTTGKPISSVSCSAILGAGATPTATTTTRKKKNIYGIENLTTWLLKQEQAGHIDAELTIVLSSISMACKQIASLLQRSSIINLTGAQGTMNIQGEDQKKLHVISN